MNMGTDLFRSISGLFITVIIAFIAVSFGVRALTQFGAFLEIKKERPGWREKGNWRDKRFLVAPQDDRPTLPDRPYLPKHEPKIMLTAFIKFLIFLFVMVIVTSFLTHGIFLIPPVVVLWKYVILIIVRKYIILWRAHGYSVLFFVGVSLGTIVISAIIAPFLRTLFFMIVGLAR